jgi:hypothetical protein
MCSLSELIKIKENDKFFQENFYAVKVWWVFRTE